MAEGVNLHVCAVCVCVFCALVLVWAQMYVLHATSW